jgi:hypothetical protein
MRTQPAVLKPQSGFSRLLSGSTETDGKSAELVPRIRDSLLLSPETRRQVAKSAPTKVLGEPLSD